MQQTSNSTLRVCAVILAHNESKTIQSIIQGTKKCVDTVLVIDNRSTDNTAEIARENGAEVIFCDTKQGYGAAQHVGHMAAIEMGFDYILQLDSDGQHDPEYIPLLLSVALSEDCDIVLGSRFLTDGSNSLPFTRRIGIKFFSRLISLIGHTRVMDATSGYKVYKTSSLKKLSKPSDTHPAVGQILEMARMGMTIREVPVEMSVRQAGKSHLNFLRLALYPLIAILAILKVMVFRRTYN